MGPDRQGMNRMGKGNQHRRGRRRGHRLGRAAFGLALAVSLLTVQCSFLREAIYPERYDRVVSLLPGEQGEQGITVGEGGLVTCDMEGMRIAVEHMSDHELNGMFPNESNQGQYSINPYTYGDYVDPALGYVRTRFTVFRVTVTNQDLAKVAMQPLRSQLTTNRPGEVLASYGVLAGSASRNFESYYRALKGPSGNEDYRFNMRMGLVRTNNYAVDEEVFKGEQYSGFLVFDPLEDEVTDVELHLKDFILKFNAFGKPLETTDVSFAFRRTVEQQVLDFARAEEWEFSEARLAAASQVVGNATGDITRDVTAIDAFARTRLEEVNDCFEGPFMEGKASEGKVTAQLVVLASGMVESAQILEATVVSDEVNRCVEERVRSWRLPPSAGVVPAAAGTQEPSDTDMAPAPVRGPTSARVTARVYFEFQDVRPE